MFGNSPETSVWADNHPEPQSLLERCASFLRRNSDSDDLIDYTVGIEEVRKETQTRIRVDVDMSQYAEDEYVFIYYYLSSWIVCFSILFGFERFEALYYWENST